MKDTAKPAATEALTAAIEARFLWQLTDSFTLDVDVTLPGSGVTAIFGPSGSGKTTLLRCIAGLAQPQQGFLRVQGEIWQDDSHYLPTHKRPLGYVFQEASLFPHLTVSGNLQYVRKRASGVDEQLYEQVLAVMNLAALLPQYPQQLSGGERQRVAIARALLIQPRLLLMDEPLASLDQAHKQDILPYLQQLRRHFAFPVLYVSHSMDEVGRLADNAVLLHEGTVKAQGGLTDVFSRIDLPLPQGNEAGVVIEGRVVERDSQWQLSRVAFEGGELWLRDSGDAVGEAVRVRVLARDVSLAQQSHSDSSILNRLPVEVSEIVADDDAAMALLRLKLGRHFLLARLTRRSVAHLQLQPGVRVWAQIKSVALVN